MTPASSVVDFHIELPDISEGLKGQIEGSRLILGPAATGSPLEALALASA